MFVSVTSLAGSESWLIGESGTEVALDGQGRDEVTFTVTNAGPQQDRVVLTISPLEGAAEAWFTVEEPQRAVAPGTAAIFRVMVAVPPDTAPGVYAFQAVAYSADHAPDESSVTSQRVTLVKQAVPQPRSFPKWILPVIAAVIVLVVGVLVLITRDGGPKLVPIPAVEGQPESAARAVLESAGFAVEVQQEPSSEVPLGSVIRTEPPGSMSVEAGTTITLVVSSGPEAIEVPYVTGLSSADAQFFLGDFSVEVTYQDVFDFTQHDVVLSQDPPAGTPLPPGSPVWLVVGRIIVIG